MASQEYDLFHWSFPNNSTLGSELTRKPSPGSGGRRAGAQPGDPVTPSAGKRAAGAAPGNGLRRAEAVTPGFSGLREVAAGLIFRRRGPGCYHLLLCRRLCHLLLLLLRPPAPPLPPPPLASPAGLAVPGPSWSGSSHTAATAARFIQRHQMSSRVSGRYTVVLSRRS